MDRPHTGDDYARIHKNWQMGILTADEYREAMTDMVDAMIAQEKMRALNEEMAICEANDDPMTYDDWETIFLNEVMI